jgi:hypothetical protein
MHNVDVGRHGAASIKTSDLGDSSRSGLVQRGHRVERGRRVRFSEQGSTAFIEHREERHAWHQCERTSKPDIRGDWRQSRLGCPAPLLVVVTSVLYFELKINVGSVVSGCYWQNASAYLAPFRMAQRNSTSTSDDREGRTRKISMAGGMAKGQSEGLAL